MTDKELTDIKKVSEFFSVIQDETRLLILRALKEKPLCVNELVKKINKSQSLISHQLIVLKKHNFVKGVRKGNFIYYELNDVCIENIIDRAMIHVCKEV